MVSEFQQTFNQSSQSIFIAAISKYSVTVVNRQLWTGQWGRDTVSNPGILGYGPFSQSRIPYSRSDCTIDLSCIWAFNLRFSCPLHLQVRLQVTRLSTSKSGNYGIEKLLEMSVMKWPICYIKWQLAVVITGIYFYNDPSHALLSRYERRGPESPEWVPH